MFGLSTKKQHLQRSKGEGEGVMGGGGDEVTMEEVFLKHTCAASSIDKKKSLVAAASRFAFVLVLNSLKCNLCKGLTHGFRWLESR